LTLCLVFFVALGANAGNAKVVGYFPSYRATTNVAAQCSKLTDIIFSFINPNTDGTLITNNPGDATFGFDMNKYIIVRDAANSAGTNLWLSLGGADNSDLRASRLSSVCQNATYRNNLATALVNFATNSSTSCYGLSIDWEFPKDATARTAHKDFMILLDQKIAASSNPNLKVAIAVGGETYGTINHTQYIDASFFSTNAGLVDEWHIMAYDFPTSYDANNHSSLSNAQASMEGWNGKGVPYSKMVLGVPFYARGISNRSLEAKYNDWTPSNTLYTGDVNGSYSYNGINTLKSKIDLAVNKGSMGILIWDLGQDLAPSHQYSLLGGIDAYILTLCNIPKPNLGPDKGFCAPNALTLDPSVPTAVGRTFAWYKDNVLINGQTGTTYSASAAGTYKVVISQGVGCTKEDEIVVVAGSPFTTTGSNGCSGTTLSMTVNNPSVGKTYDWYDQAVGGTKVGTGTTLSQVFNATTTYYVEEKASGVVTYNSSTSTVPANYAWNGSTDLPRADFMTVLTDLTIKSVRVFANGPSGATFKIRVLKASDNTLVSETSTITVNPDGTKQSWEYTLQDVTVNLTLVPGEYFITAAVTAGSLAMKFGPTPATGTNEAGVYTIGDHCHTNFGGGFLKTETTEGSYINAGQLYKYVIETGANASCGRTAATVTTITCGPPVITITKPTSNQDFPFDNNPINLEATVTDEGSVSSVSFEIWDGGTKLATITPNASGSTYSGTWTPTTWYTSKQYTLKVIAVDNNSNSSNSTVNFTVTSGNSVNEVVSVNNVTVFPNPSTDNMNVSVELAKGGQATIVVRDLAGRTIYSAVQSMNSGNNVSSVDVSSLAAGSYLLNVTVNGENINKTFSVIK